MVGSEEGSEGHHLGDPARVEEAGDGRPLTVDTFRGPVQVRWAPDEAVTGQGQLPFFIDYLKQTGLFDSFVADCPLRYTSPNAPRKRDILGTMMLGIIGGAQRYAHVSALRNDAVNPPLLDMAQVSSEDSVRRALGRMDEDEAEAWLARHLDHGVRPLLREPWILDTDTSTKPIYGHQEGAEVGHNPTKPGRPSHVYHTYIMAHTRLVLDVEMTAGNKHRSRHSMPGLLRLLDSMRPEERPVLVRGDADYGTEPVMAALEARDQDYLFRLRLTKTVQRKIGKMVSRHDWCAAGQGWEAATTTLRLNGWSRHRSVMVLRRPIRQETAAPVAPEETPGGGEQLSFMEILPRKKAVYEYTALVMSPSPEGDPMAVAQLYRDRADAENVFDELKNQWGWGGFTTNDLKRTRITARMTALFYNWWSLYVRLIDPWAPREALTSRPRLMNAVARATRHGRQTTLTVTSAHAEGGKLREAFAAVAAFLRHIQQTAPQLTETERWCRVLGEALKPYLNGRTPKPPPNLLPA